MHFNSSFQKHHTPLIDWEPPEQHNKYLLNYIHIYSDMWHIIKDGWQLGIRGLGRREHSYMSSHAHRKNLVTFCIVWNISALPWCTKCVNPKQLILIIINERPCLPPYMWQWMQKSVIRYFDKCLYSNACDSAILSGKLTKFGI